MTLRRKTIKGSRDLIVGEALSVVASFLRYLILARLLGAVDFGIAAALALAIQTLQTVSNMATNMLMVQSRDGEQPTFQATAHALQVIRGLLCAVMVLLLARPISSLFGIPEARWAFLWLAVVPLLEGFVHLDANRLERDLRFMPSLIVTALPKVIAALAAWPMAVWLGDYSVMLWLLATQGGATLLLSHSVAERPYRIAWDSQYLSQILRFSWPLLLNGILLFCVFQGDRFIVGTVYTMRDLGVYSVSVALVMTLSGALFKLMHTLMLPLLSGVQEDPQAFTRRYKACATAFACIAACYGPVLIVGGEPLVVLLCGEEYRAAGVLVGWLAAAQSLRIIRLGPSLAAMAKGDTQCLMYANVCRLSGVVAAAVAAVAGAGLGGVAAAAVLGEVAAFPIPVLRLSRRHHLSAGICLRPAVVAIAAVALSALVVLANGRNVAIVAASVVVSIMAIGFGVWAALSFSSLRRWVVGMVGMPAQGVDESLAE